MIDIRRTCAVALMAALTAACSGDSDRKTVDSADGELEEPRRKGPPYKVAPVTAPGAITGTVTMPPAGAAAAAAPGSPPAGRCAAPAPGEQQAIVYLENIQQGRALPAGTPRRFELSAAACELSPRLIVATAGGTLNLSNALGAVHRVTFTFEGLKNPMLRVPFSHSGQVVPSERVLAVPGVVEVASDQDPSVRARILVVEHPYAVATSDGSFTLDSVPPGNYSLVALTPSGRAAAAVAVQSGQTTNTSLQPTPR